MIEVSSTIYRCDILVHNSKYIALYPLFFLIICSYVMPSRIVVQHSIHCTHIWNQVWQLPWKSRR